MLREISKTTRIFVDGAVLSYRALFHWFNPLGYTMSKIINPVFQIIFFTCLGQYATGRDSAAYYVVGNVIQTAAVSGIFGVIITVGNERRFGTLSLLFGTPANRFLIFVGRATMHIIDGALGVVWCFLCGVLLLGLDLSEANLPLLGLVILLTCFATSGLGLMLGSLSLIIRDIWLISNSVYFLMMIICGVNFPVERLPAWVQFIAYIIPMTRSVEMARRVIGGAAFGQIAELFGTEVIIGCLYIIMGYILFTWLETQAKRSGTLEAI